MPVRVSTVALPITSLTLAPAWRVDASYSYARNRFDRYSLDGTDYADNEIPGLPRHLGFVELAWRPGRWRRSRRTRAARLGWWSS